MPHHRHVAIQAVAGSMARGVRVAGGKRRKAGSRRRHDTLAHAIRATAASPPERVIPPAAAHQAITPLLRGANGRQVRDSQCEGGRGLVARGS